MKNIFAIIALTVWYLPCIAQVNTAISAPLDLNRIEQLQMEYNGKIDAAFTAMKAVQDAGRYIKSLSDLFGNGEITLPVGIKNGDYELIIQKILYDEKTEKKQISATCAFRFKDTGQKVAFEGSADIQGKNGLGTHGELALIAPVRRNIGNASAIVLHEGSRVRFGCDGVEDFATKLTWIVTSPDVIPVDNRGTVVNTPISATVETCFQDFDNYTLSLNIDRSFMFKGLKDIFFTIKGATLDQSDTETSAMTVFPEGYLSASEEFNLWKGVAFSELSLHLPAIFKSPNDGERMTLSMKNALFDENGFTARLSATDVLNSALLDPETWSISVNDFSLGFLKNQIVAAGFGGEINIPPFGRHSLRPYMAEYNHASEEFIFTAGIVGKFDFPALRSSLELYETSTLSIAFRDADIYPVIDASGLLTVNAPVNEKDSTKKFSVPDIPFEHLKISRDAPYVSIGAIGLGGSLRTPKVAGFELLISHIQSFNNGAGSGLSFDADVTLTDMFGGDTKILLYGDYAHWKFNKVGVERINVDFKSKAFSIAGGVWFKNGDPLYGDGFRGDIQLDLLGKFKLDAIAVFGKKDDYRYFLTDVFLELPPTPGLPIPPALTFYGFGGGLYRRMQQTSTSYDTDFGKSLSGINYIPDKTVGMGLMASTKFCLISGENTMNAKVGFEIQFNSSGGMNFVQFRGDVAVMDIPGKWGKMSDNIAKKMEAFEAEGKVMRAADKTDLKEPENKESGFLTASLNMKYDVINSTFSADLAAYLNAGVITGAGANNKLGWASAFFSPTKWYTYMGTPTDRMGVNVLGFVKLDSYFMLGADIPGLPLPPEKVLRNLSVEKQNQLKREASSLALAKGVAFGAGLSVDFKAKLPPFYAGFGVGLGSEFVLRDLRGRTCSNYSGTPGINGWYADVQAWAWIEAAIGIEAKIFRKTRQFNILDLSVAALLQGAGPNPMYFAGAVGGQFSVLGGLIKGKCSFDFEMGEKCILSNGSPFGEEIIAQLTPANAEKDVNVFVAPQAVFNIPVGVAMAVDDEDVRSTYMVTLEEFSVKYKDSATPIEGRPKLSNDGTVYMFDPEEPFESQKEMVVYAKVAFKKKNGNNWQYVTGDDGKPVFEDKTETFTSGDRPKYILPEHVKCSYPAARQYNYYPDEYKAGYIQVTENYEYLFTSDKPEGYKQLLRVSDLTGDAREIAFTHKANAAGSDIRFEIDFSLANIPLAGNRIHRLAIVNVPEKTSDIKQNITEYTTAAANAEEVSITKQQAQGNLEQLEEKEIYSLHFKTSIYKTFAEKMATFDTKGEGWRNSVEPFVHHIKANLRGAELFDKYEIQWNENTLPLVRFDAQIDQTNWYDNSFYKNMYQTSTAYRQGMVDNRKGIDMRSFGEPPAAAVLIEAGDERQVTDTEIATGAPAGYNFQSVFTYALPYWCARDFFYMKNTLGEKQLRGGGVTASEEALMANDFPSMVTRGSYPVRVKYVLPGKEIETSAVDIEMYCPVE
ncbi:MAG: hypothetical protein LBF89_00770 [Bacteroidales bacterium]|jgi:hypothetical protein|nr:hypothetical protein [Bacteroidales bacterium]